MHGQRTVHTKYIRLTQTHSSSVFAALLMTRVNIHFSCFCQSLSLTVVRYCAVLYCTELLYYTALCCTVLYFLLYCCICMCDEARKCYCATARTAGLCSTGTEESVTWRTYRQWSAVHERSTAKTHLPVVHHNREVAAAEKLFHYSFVYKNKQATLIEASANMVTSLLVIRVVHAGCCHTSQGT